MLGWFAADRASNCATFMIRWHESAANQPERDAPELQTAPLESLVMHAMLTSPARDPEAALAATPDPPSREAVRAATRRLRAVGALAPAPALQPEPDPGRSRVPAKTTETTETTSNGRHRCRRRCGGNLEIYCEKRLRLGPKKVFAITPKTAKYAKYFGFGIGLWDLNM